MSTEDTSTNAAAGVKLADGLGPLPVGALTAGEEALLRDWAEQYAARKAAAERERCAKLCDQKAEGHSVTDEALSVWHEAADLIRAA